MKKALFRKTLAGLLGASLMLSGTLTAVSAEEAPDTAAAEETAIDASAVDAAEPVAESAVPAAGVDTETIYQAALMDSLAQGNFDGFMSVEEVKQYGDTGIGTFDGLDGVMIMLDGVVYRSSGEGRVVFVPNEEKIPFADLTFFEEDGSSVLSDVNDLAGLEEQLNSITEENGRNLFYVIKATGTFSHIKVRTQPKQTAPYTSFDEAIASSAIELDYNDIPGTIVGICCPEYMSSITGSGWHLHFISEDKTRGGHVLDAATASLEVSYDITGGFKLYLPEEGTFQGLELATVPGGSAGTSTDAQASQQEGAEGVIAEEPAAESTDTEPKDPDDHPEPAPEGEEEEEPAAAPAEPAEGETTYVVKEGDMLYGIASQFNVTPEEIAERNRDLMIQTAIENGYYIDSDYDFNYAEYIFPGEELIIPKAGGSEAETAAEAEGAEGSEAEGTETAATPESIKERGVLRVGTTGDYRPMTYLEENGEYWGFDIEFAKDLADALEVDLEFVPTTWPTLMDDTKAGKFDLAVGGITITDERKAEALMSDGYLANGKTVLCRTEDADKYISLEAINQPDVRVMENPGGLNEKFAEENLPEASLTIHETNEEIPGLIAAGEADVMITEIMEAAYYAGDDDRLAAPLLDDPFTHGELGFLIPKGSEALLDFVNSFIKDETASGRIDALSGEYIYEYTGEGKEDASSETSETEEAEETEKPKETEAGKAEETEEDKESGKAEETDAESTEKTTEAETEAGETSETTTEAAAETSETAETTTETTTEAAAQIVDMEAAA